MDREQTTPAAPQGEVRRLLSRTETLRDAVNAAAAQLGTRLEPLLQAGGKAADELGTFFDPEALDEALKKEKPKAEASTAALREQAQVAQRANEAELQRLGGSLIDPRRIMLKDKMAFVVGVANICLTSFWVGRWPATYHIFWLVKDLVLFTLRYLVYRQKGMHYMMLEYCYAANLLAFTYLFFCPQNALLRRVVFAIMTGPLQMSIVALRNSLVLHDGEKMTTLMMHSSPAISAWCMRWYPPPKWTAGMSAAQLAEWNSANWLDMALLPAGLNLAWVAVYYLIIFVWLNKRIQQRGYQNMFTAMVTRPSARKSALSKLVLAAPQPVQPLFYLGIHSFACWLSLLPTKLYFDSFYLHTAVLLAILLWATWNGANFYFRVFAKKLMQQQQQQAGAGQAQPQAACGTAGAAGAGDAKKAS